MLELVQSCCAPGQDTSPTMPVNVVRERVVAGANDK